MTGQQINKPNQAIEMGGNVQSKTAIPKTFSTILPNSIGQQNIRPASVSTQTGQTQTTMHQATFQSQKAGTKVRGIKFSLTVTSKLQCYLFFKHVFYRKT